jgi:membrane protease YdiL (CAAX protease family)
MNPAIVMLRRNPTASFLVLTFVLCWGVGALLKGTPVIAPDGLFVGGILIAALVLAFVTDGLAGLRALGRRLVQWRVGRVWYAVVLALPLLILAAVVGLMPLFGAEQLAWEERPGLGATVVLFVVFLILPLGAPFAEEVAWRGFALPRLLAGHSPLAASLILGIVWAPWHLPAILSDPALRVPVPFLLAILPLSVLFTWLFVHTGGSVLIAVLFHAWYDVALGYVAEMVATSDYALMWWLIFAVQGIVAVAVVLRTRAQWVDLPGSRNPADPVGAAT